jgi:SAM-dependent methyltransferase
VERYDPELYALTHRGNQGDLEFYVDACRGAKRILELGCGYGRLTIPLAELGAQVTGLDCHPGMLEALRTRLGELDAVVRDRVGIVQGDMSAFELGGRFDRILIPYNGLYCLLDDAQILECFRAARHHLEPEGALLLDGYLVEDFDDEDPSCEGPVFVSSVYEQDREIRIFERSDWHPDRQFIEVFYRYEIQAQAESASRTVEYSIPQRYLLIGQLRALLAKAGLEARSVHIGFPGVEAEDPQIVLSAVCA